MFLSDGFVEVFVVLATAPCACSGKVGRAQQVAILRTNHQDMLTGTEQVYGEWSCGDVERPACPGPKVPMSMADS